MEINSLVCVLKTKELKTVIETEIINGEKILYMNDLTSYHEKEVTEEDWIVREGLLNKMQNNRESLENLLKSLCGY